MPHFIEVSLPYLTSTVTSAVTFLDPSLFQNIILGILAIFIPFAIVFLTNVVNTKDKRSDFEKMVLSEEVLGTTKVFALSVTALIFFSFFESKDLSFNRKIVAIVAIILFIWLLWKPFKKILRFSEGYKKEFELAYLEKLNLSRILVFRNKLKKDRMLRAWGSFWSVKSADNSERDFTLKFISHVDQAMSAKNYHLATNLGEAYQKNIENRQSVTIGYELLPKILEWNEKLWGAQKKWLYRLKLVNKASNLAIVKRFTLLRKTISYINRKVNIQEEYFWNWHFFQQQLFPDAAKITLRGGNGHHFFSVFKQFLDTAVNTAEQFKDKDDKEHQFNYVSALVRSFSRMYFEEVNTLPRRFDVWDHEYPIEWRITSSNSKNVISRMILGEFLEWTRGRIYSRYVKETDEKLNEVVKGLFPGVDSGVFPEFLSLIYTDDLKHVIQEKASFYMIGSTFVTWGEHDDDKILQQLNQRKISERQETAEVIFSYFTNWKYLEFYKNDLSEEELTKWDDYSVEERKNIIARIRSGKFQKALDELNSKEIVELGDKTEQNRLRRLSLINLFELLLERNRKDEPPIAEVH